MPATSRLAKNAIEGSAMADNRYEGPLEKVNDYCWRIPKSYKPGMRVDRCERSEKAAFPDPFGNPRQNLFRLISFFPEFGFALKTFVCFVV